MVCSEPSPLLNHPPVANRQRIAWSGASFVRHRITPRNVGLNRHLPRGLVAVPSPPPPSGGIALECSTAPVVVPRNTRFSRRFAGFSVEPPASARRRHQPGECESMGAQVPGAAFACISKLSDALSVRGDKKYAMRCRIKPRDALSVRTPVKVDRVGTSGSAKRCTKPGNYCTKSLTECNSALNEKSGPGVD